MKWNDIELWIHEIIRLRIHKKITKLLKVGMKQPTIEVRV